MEMEPEVQNRDRQLMTMSRRRIVPYRESVERVSTSYRIMVFTNECVSILRIARLLK